MLYNYPMLTRPDVTDETIVAILAERFGVRASGVEFLPIGADVNGFAFRITAADGRGYFLKLRRGRFDRNAILVPIFLHARGIDRVMAPIPTLRNRPRTRTAGFAWMLYPYFEGRNGFEAPLSPAQWIALGESLRAVHGVALPPELAARLPREESSPRLRNIVRAYDQQVRETTYGDPIAARFAAFWREKADEIARIVDRAEQLGGMLRERGAELVLCHSDLHGGNVLVGASDALAIVDWDEPILAPKERDLMFVGAGIGDVWSQPEEAVWFYEGYGAVEVDRIALAYYRNERIVADFAAYADQIIGVQGSAEDREEGLRQIMGQFHPGGVIDIAHKS